VTKIYDVGTGYSGVFLFLAYRLYGWVGLGVDTSGEAIAHATQIAN
jgi:23S rRNA A1618 N6-methylase RlmF